MNATPNGQPRVTFPCGQVTGEKPCDLDATKVLLVRRLDGRGVDALGWPFGVAPGSGRGPVASPDRRGAPVPDPAAARSGKGRCLMAARFLLPAAEVAESLLTIGGKRQYVIVPMPAADEGGTA